ncbi:protein FAR1-RELATED SEQUENCE 5-like [Tripterygium wilfordii]|uniref:protein FAR1-RELATED SEQUENCE 5-like n=1 Tax=Tripterygium wilfordii TaxID=458696 RepID=UPI0018F85115|nr:protein FAR1-RELATED SEQUENCE 5-like [Tripterygium wilfordii]
MKSFAGGYSTDFKSLCALSLLDLIFVHLVSTFVGEEGGRRKGNESPKKIVLATVLNMNVISDKCNLTPEIGLEFNTLDEAWNYWIDYDKHMGFSVRKAFVNKSEKDVRVTMRGFVCSEEGVRRVDQRQLNPDSHRDETRTNCPVKLSLSLVQDSGKYRVYEFVAEHNHLLHLANITYMMRSQRNISEVQGFEIDLACSAGIKLKKAHELMSRQAGGRSNLGFTKDDQKYYLRTKREKDMEYGEAGSILRYFQEETIKNPSFNYAVQLDNEEQITNIFWADSRMLIDYIYFGDVIIFDTTYGTNKALRPLVVFTGFNHHRGIIVFGAALLYDETIASFKRLFKTFLDAHKEKMPQTIFTDQDATMAKAINEVMPRSVGEDDGQDGEPLISSLLGRIMVERHLVFIVIRDGESLSGKYGGREKQGFGYVGREK